METSLRYGGDSKSLRFHGKEKLPIDNNFLLQLSGELDTKIGAPTFANAMIKFHYPDLPTSLGVGLQCNRHGKIHYHARGKSSFQVTSDGLLYFNVKGRCYADEKSRQVSYTGAAEFVCNIFKFKKDQDLRLKFGYDLIDKIPYLQIRENNWTFNADGNRKWNVRYDL